MCQAQIVLQTTNGNEIFMQDVIFMRVEQETVWLSRFFEDPAKIRARVKEVDFLKHIVTLIPFGEEEGSQK